MIGYRRMKATNNWKLERKGPDVVLTRKSYDKESGERHDNKVKTITSSQVESMRYGIESQINKLKEDLHDIDNAISDIKKLEAIIDPSI